MDMQTEMAKEIFVLEDDRDIGFILNHVLFEEGYRVQVFETLSGIRRALHFGTPDLLLMDVRLPDGNGMELCAELKGQQALSVPVLMMSADWDPRAKGLCSADDFIAKPFNIDEMLGKIEGYLRRAG